MTSIRLRPSLLSGPGARALLGSSIIARLPLAMFSIALLVHAQRLTGSFAVAGAVTGAYAIASAFSAPLLGGLVDRCGQTRVLVGGATATALVLLANGLLSRGAPALLLVALGGAAGLGTPPLAACVRTLLPAIVADPCRLPALFALESTVLELTFVAGPPLALGLGSLWSPGAAVAASGLVMLAGTLAFAAQPASRRWRPNRHAPRARGGALRSPALRTLVLILFGTGAAFGATEVGVTAAAHALGSTTAAGPLLGLWGLGSLLGGIAATRLGGGARGPRGLILLLAMLALAHGALILTTGSVLAIGVVITLAGGTIAPTVSSIYAMVDAAAPVGTRTEAYSWQLAAALVGGSLGNSAAGSLAQSSGAAAAFTIVAAAGGLAVLTALLRSRSLETATPDEDGLPNFVPDGAREDKAIESSRQTHADPTHIGGSVDGYVASTDGRPAFLSMPDFVPGKSHGHSEFIENCRAAVMGRTTFDPALAAPSWPWPGLEVYVLTSRPLPPNLPSRVTAAPTASELLELLHDGGFNGDVRFARAHLLAHPIAQADRNDLIEGEPRSHSRPYRWICREITVLVAETNLKWRRTCTQSPQPMARRSPMTATATVPR